MKLKLSPLKATQMLDMLIKKGYELLDSIKEDHWKEYEKATKEEVEDSLINTRFGPIRVSEEITDGYWEEYQGWYDLVIPTLKEIFIDETPIYIIINANKELSPLKNPIFGRDQVDLIEATFEAKLETLVVFYRDVSQQIRSPLSYVQKKAQIKLAEWTCQLQPDSNEAELCRYMFQFDIGEFQEMEDVYGAICGKQNQNLDKEWQKIVINAFQGVNRKTKQIFGFPIFQKQKNILALSVPPHFIKAI